MALRLSEMGDFVAVVLDAIPSPIFVVDDDVQIMGYNLAASRMVVQEPEVVIRRRAGEILHCVHATETPAGCGRAEFCQDCPVRIPFMNPSAVIGWCVKGPGWSWLEKRA